jgi:protein O-GlcNAc transferase
VEEALEPLSQAAALLPSAITLNNLGLAKLELHRFTDALGDFAAAIRLDAGYPEAQNNLGLALIKLQRFDEALVPLTSAINSRPNYPKALTNRAAALLELDRIDEAYADLENSYALDPQQEFLGGLVLHTAMQRCDWRHLSKLQSNIELALRDRQKAAAGFAIISAVDDPELLRIAAEVWGASQAQIVSVPPSHDVSTSPKLRVGYFSADFHNHATAHLIAGLIEAHDRTRFEIIAFSFGPSKNDAMRSRLQHAFDQFHDVRLLSDAAIAEFAREQRIDIAVDLKGYTQSSRPAIFTHRPAPIQVNYLGYPGTMGAPFIDYIIADHFLIPEAAEKHYSERIIRLPDSYQANDNQRPRPSTNLSRRELGLPEDRFIFCSFNNNYKITPEVFDTWMTILRSKSDSILWLLEDNATAAGNLRQAASAANVDPARIVFAPRVSVPEHLARHRAADHFVDTWPCNAHTTASDALWMELPIITLAQRSFASRVAGSLLTAVGLPQLICRDRESYIKLALRLADDHQQLAALRQQLSKDTAQLPLFDTERFCRHFETALAHAIGIFRDGKPPQNFSVTTDGTVF